MASAGVVGMAEVVVPNSNPTGGSISASAPAFWSMAWVGIAVLVMLMLHLALIGRAAR